MTPHAPGRPLSRIALALAALAILALAPLRATADDYDRWYKVEMSGKRAGYMHAFQKTDGDRITSGSLMVLDMGRAGGNVSMKVESAFIETKEGKPLSMRSLQQLGLTPKVSEFTFGETEIAITTVEGDQTTRSTKKLPEGSWLTPAAATNYVAQRLKAEADTIVVRTIDPLSGPQPETMTLTAFEKTTVEAMGKKVPAIKCTSTTTAAKGLSLTEYLDENGVPVRSQISLGPIKLTIVASEKEGATAEGREAPEMMLGTFIKPDKPIRKARTLKKAVYRLSVPEGKMPELPGTGAQHVAPDGEHAARVTIGPASTPAPEADVKDAAYLASTSFLRHEDPEIRKLTDQALRNAGQDRASRAEALRAFVEKHITTKDMNVGFASASEVARSQKGDCSEHGVLLAAMLRADGIPARVVSGLVYVESMPGVPGAEGGIFGYHMWAQALLEKDGKPTWVDLDGTLPKRAFDATHIALSTSALAEGEEAQSLSSILALMGRLAITVESAE